MQDDFGKLVLRVVAGGLLLLHGVHKLLNGIAPIKAMIVAHNIPVSISYGVYLGEVVGPILVILGLFSRIGGTLMAINMLFAILLAGSTQIASLTGMGGYALELEALYLASALSIVLFGAGRFSAGGGRWN